jgi:hypothetical protein
MVKIDYDKMCEENMRANEALERKIKRCHDAGKHVGKQQFMIYELAANRAYYQCECGWIYSRAMTEQEIKDTRENQPRAKVLENSI